MASTGDVRDKDTTPVRGAVVSTPDHADDIQQMTTSERRHGSHRRPPVIQTFSDAYLRDMEVRMMASMQSQFVQWEAEKEHQYQQQYALFDRQLQVQNEKLIAAEKRYLDQEKMYKKHIQDLKLQHEKEMMEIEEKLRDLENVRDLSGSFETIDHTGSYVPPVSKRRDGGPDGKSRGMSIRFPTEDFHPSEGHELPGSAQHAETHGTGGHAVTSQGRAAVSSSVPSVAAGTSTTASARQHSDTAHPKGFGNTPTVQNEHPVGGHQGHDGQGHQQLIDAVNKQIRAIQQQQEMLSATNDQLAALTQSMMHDARDVATTQPKDRGVTSTPVMMPMTVHPPVDTRPCKEAESKLPCFYGIEDKTHNWPMYHKLFDHVARNKRWSYELKGQILQGKLRGDALNVNDELRPDQYEDYNSLVSALTGFYNPRKLADKFRNELAVRAQGVDESIADYGRALRKVAELAFPDEPERRNDECLRVLKLGLRDPVLRGYVADKDPPTLHAAIIAAEGYYSSMKTALPGLPTIDNAALPGTDINAVTVSSKDKSKDTANNGQGRGRGKRPYGGKNKQDVIIRLLQELAGKRRSNADLTNVTCYECQQKGHLSYDCPQKNAKQDTQSADSPLNC